MTTSDLDGAKERIAAFSEIDWFSRGFREDLRTVLTALDNPPPSGAGASQEAVARIARMHFYTGNGRCGCGWVYSVERIDDDWASHVAAELMKLWEPKP